MKIRVALITLLIVTLALGTGPEPASASPQPAVSGMRITVNTTVDDVEANGNCTLREAVIAANTDRAVDRCRAGRGADLILLQAKTYELSIPGQNEDEARNGDLDILAPLTIRGKGADRTTIQWLVEPEGFPADRLLDIFSQAGRVRMDGFTLRNGIGDDHAGGITNRGMLSLEHMKFIDIYDGYIDNTGSLSVSDTFFTQSPNFDTYFRGIRNIVPGTVQIIHTRFEGINGRGMILYNESQMTVIDSIITNNPTDDGGGIENSATGNLKVYRTTINASSYIYSNRGAIYNAGVAELVDVTITNSASYAGGGIRNMGGTLSLIKSTLRDNPARYGGGAIDQNGGSMFILGSTIDNNFASTAGGILSEGGKLVIANSTISNNEGFEAESAISAVGLITITNSTISGNTSQYYWAAYLDGAYLDHVTIVGNVTEWGTESSGLSGKHITIRNSILAGNGAPECDPQSGPITSAGYNLVDVVDGCNWVPAEGDQLGTAASPIDPLLGPLADNGGPTLTNALLEGSPAIDTGDPDGCLPVDQRGVLRPQGTGCDIGAYEYGPLAVSIDIRPGTSDNVINRKSRTTAPVAILSTPTFDAATQVDRETLTFGRTGDEQSLARKKLIGEPLCEVEDVNGDGLLDLACSFRIPKMNFRCGDPAGLLKGRTLEGAPFSGVDLVRVVPCG